MLFKRDGGRLPGSDCRLPVLNGQDEIEMTGLVASPDGKIIFKETVTGNDPEEVGSAVPLLWLTKEQKI